MKNPLLFLKNFHNFFSDNYELDLNIKIQFILCDLVI